MCGIAGRLALSDTLHPDTEALLRHRGPDDAGRVTMRTRKGLLSMVQTRLAILDLSEAGHQPMQTDDGRFTIVYNGEVYNYRSIRERLKRRFVFRSDSDTEIVLNGFVALGPRIFEELEGMYALAIWDAQEETLTLARDPLGIKPLYVARLQDGGVTFASELQALLIQPGLRHALREESVAEYVSFLWIPEPFTMFRDVVKHEPGSYAQYGLGRSPVTTRFWDLHALYADKLRVKDRDLAHLTAETLAGSIRGQMLSDVPLGAFYSGGLDSTLIVAAMSRNSSQPVIAETIGYQSADQTFDIAPNDVVYARRVLRHLPPNIAYHESILKDDELALLPRVVAALGDPIGDPAAISTLRIAESVRPRATVMLSGMGAEELWGGYARYWAALWACASWGRLPAGVQSSVRSLLGYMPVRMGRSIPLLRHLKKFARADGRSLPESFLAFETYIGRGDLARALNPPWSEGNPWERPLALFKASSDLDPLDQMAYVDSLTFLPSLNLAYTDRASMAASLEVRVPFLSKPMVELAAKSPSAWRLRGRVGKWGIRKAAELLDVPREAIWRAKTGFGAPIRAWMTRQDHPVIRRFLDRGVIVERGIFKPEWVDGLRREQMTGQQDHALLLYAVMALEQWFRIYVDRDEPMTAGFPESPVVTVTP